MRRQAAQPPDSDAPDRTQPRMRVGLRRRQPAAPWWLPAPAVAAPTAAAAAAEDPAPQPPAPAPPLASRADPLQQRQQTQRQQMPGGTTSAAGLAGPGDRPRPSPAVLSCLASLTTARRSSKTAGQRQSCLDRLHRAAACLCHELPAAQGGRLVRWPQRAQPTSHIGSGAASGRAVRQGRGPRAGPGAAQRADTASGKHPLGMTRAR